MEKSQKPRILVFASGTKDGGGSGFRTLALISQKGDLAGEIAGVVSNHENGGVRGHAEELGIPFIHFSGPWTPEAYKAIVRTDEPWRYQFFALSGWLKPVKGLDLNTNFSSKTVFNIHPGPLPKFGGPGMYGHHVHEAVIAAFKRGETQHSEVCMHFVTDGYDEGPVFFRQQVPIYENDTPATLAKKVNAIEHMTQWMATNEVVAGRIYWDGVNASSLNMVLAP